MIDITCDDCGHNWQLPPEFAGRKVRCSECKLEIILPGDNKWHRFTQEGLPFPFFCSGALIVVALWFSWLYIGEFIQNRRLSKWPQVKCHIIESRVTAAGEDRFEVKYSYQWQGEVYESRRYQGKFQGIQKLAEFEAEELVQKFKKGTQSVCYVNPQKPDEAVLFTGRPYLLGFMVIPAFLITVGIRQFYVGLKDLLTSGRQRPAENKMWKNITVFAVIVAFFMNFLVTLLVIFVLFMAGRALGEGLGDVRKKFVKMQPEDDVAEDQNNIAHKKVRFTVLEKAVFAISAAVYLVIMFFIALHCSNGEQFALFGLIFSALTLGLLMTMVVCMILLIMHGYHYAAMEEHKIPYRDKKFDLPLWTLLISNLIVIIWAVADKWSLITILWVYWGQGICIGPFFLVRSLVSFKKSWQNLGDKSKKTDAIAHSAGFFFYYLLSHGMYLGFLFLFFEDDAVIDLLFNRVILFAVGIFFLQEVINLTYDLIKGFRIPHPEKLIAHTSFRFFPMYFMIMGFGFLAGVVGLNIEHSFLLILFLSGKAFADVCSCLYTRKGFIEKMKDVF